ncbi:hypothetical protein XPA_007242 [Xanthoria parietina]
MTDAHNNLIVLHVCPCFIAVAGVCSTLEQRDDGLLDMYHGSEIPWPPQPSEGTIQLEYPISSTYTQAVDPSFGSPARLTASAPSSDIPNHPERTRHELESALIKLIQ